MPTEGYASDDVRGGEAPVPSTNGAMARRRAWRIAILIGLALALAALVYALYYFSQNQRMPGVTITSSEQQVRPFEFLYAFSGTGAATLTQPTGVAVIGERVYVTDSGLSNVRAFSTQGAHLFDFGAISDGGKTKLLSPVHLTVGPDSTIWVTDRSLDGIYVFDRDGKFVKKFLPNGDASYRWSPLALAFGPNGDLYVSDVAHTDQHQILVLGSDGKVKAQWGSTEQVANATDSPGKFMFPNGIALSASATNTLVFVADGDNRRVQVFRPDGTFVRIINTSGTPRGLAFDAKSDHLLVVDALAHQVDIYDTDGRSLASFGTQGTSPGQFNYPNDITLDARGRAYVTDRANNQVQVWGLPVAEIPGITKITPNTAWVPFLLAALAALAAFLFARRRRRFVVMPDFIEAMAVAGALEAMDRKRFYWADTKAQHAAVEGRVVEHVNLGALVNGEAHSDAEATSIREKLGVSAEQAQVLALAKWARTLCTQDVELARYAVRLGIDVYDRDTWLKKFGPKGR